MPQEKVLGGQLNIVSVSEDLAADATAIQNLAAGVLADPTATASFDADYVRRDGTVPMVSGLNDLSMDGESFLNVNNIALLSINSVVIGNYLVTTDLGVSVQDWDAGLDSIAGLVTAADKMIYTSGLDTYLTTDLSVFMRTLLADTTNSLARATLGATDDATVATNHYTKAQSDAAAGGAGSKADKVAGVSGNAIQFGAAGALVDSGIASSSLLVSGDIDSTVQAWDMDLDVIAAMTPADGEGFGGSGGSWVLNEKCRSASFSVTTTDATLTDLAVLGVALSGRLTVTFRAHGHEVATDDMISEVIHATVKRTAGGVTSLVGAPSVPHSVKPGGAAAWTFGVIGDDTSDTIKLQVTGEAAHTIIWSVCVDWTED